MKALDQHLAPHANALSIRNKRMEVLGANIANAATPNYKARDIDFGQAFQQAMGESGNLLTTDAKHIGSLGSQGPETRYRVPVSAALDGNTVELHVEQLQFAENATRYEASLQFLSDRLRGMRSALRGE
jgi:flagellar basal-body rod protein FlgB